MGILSKVEIAREDTQGVGWESTPTHSRGRDQQVVGKVSEWLDSFDELGDGRGAATGKPCEEVNSIVLGLQKQNQIAKVALALYKDPDYEEWWGQVLEWRQEIIDRLLNATATMRPVRPDGAGV